ncbi:hypothetical protein IC582_024094 [Cucumis melo]
MHAVAIAIAATPRRTPPPSFFTSLILWTSLSNRRCGFVDKWCGVREARFSSVGY